MNDPRAANRQSWRAYHAVKVHVREHFPAAFAPQGHQTLPLAIGIRADLIAACAAQFSPWKVMQFLALYTNRQDYLYAVTFGGVRVGLDGEPVGEIIEAHRAHSASLLVVEQPAELEAA